MQLFERIHHSRNYCFGAADLGLFHSLKRHGHKHYPYMFSRIQVELPRMTVNALSGDL